MQLGIIGMGKMGLNMALRLTQKGHEPIGFDLNSKALQEAKKNKLKVVSSLTDFKKVLKKPRIIWVMVPAGEPTNSTIAKLKDILESGDIIIDGGNSNYKDAQPTAQSLKEKSIGFIDAGTSGGIWGLQYGYCLMVGGEKTIVKKAEPIFKALAPENGYAHVGPVGAGHFVKMVHNGIEYAMLQAYAEGFSLMEKAQEFSLDLHQIASIWRYGSVVRSWLLELLEIALRDSSKFNLIEGIVVDSGEGRWTALEAIERGIPAPAITTSLFERYASRGNSEFANKIIAALRNEFGGHAVYTKSSSTTKKAKKIK
jgi:6-phosphogluconate dehydrogenase